MSFTEALIENSPSTLEQQVVEEIQAAFSEWENAPGNLETWVIKAFARISSTVREQAAVSSAAIFKKFGETIVNVPPITAVPATVTSTWTLIDTAGHTIEAGTEVQVGVEGPIFRVVSDVVVAEGSSTTGAGAVTLEAVESGTGGNGLSASAEPVSPVAFVGSIELYGVTAGGVDEEDEDAYLERLTEELQLLSRSLIVGRDFEIDARAVAGVARAKAVEAYRSDKEEDEALCVSVYAVDSAGATLSSGIKEALQERQQAQVPSGVLVFVGDPTYTKIKVKAQFKVLSGFDPEVVEAAVTARLTEYLDPANWGLPTQGDASTSGGWENRTSVYRFELVSEVDRVGGVDRVTLLELAAGAGALGTSDLSLAGKVTLTEPGALTVEAV